MRTLATILLMTLTLPAQTHPGMDDVQERLRQLERKLHILELKVDRVQDLEQRVASLERSLLVLLGRREPLAGRRPDPETPHTTPSGHAPFQSMPYGDERIFIATQARHRSTLTPAGRTRHRLEVELVELSQAEVDAALPFQKDGFKYLGLQLKKERPRKRLVIEDLRQSEAASWEAILSPIPVGQGASELSAWRTLSFARVAATRKMGRTGYGGNAGSVRAYRGKFYWDENNVFFLEDGTLKMLGASTASHHIQLPRAPKAPPLQGAGR